MVGVQPGSAATQVQTALRTHQVGSVIFLGGWNGAVAVKAATDQLQATSPGPDLFVAADQEGGAVQQLKGTGFSPLPSALRQGTLDPGSLRTQAQGLARELAAVGVNVDLAPVADTVAADFAAQNGPIGKYSRQYGSDPAAVADDVATVIEGLQSAGVVATAKHFPGLGRLTGNTDSTAAGITDPTSSATDSYLMPFQRAIAHDVGMVMISSGRYPKLDAANQAVFSEPIITGLLRTQLGYQGVTITDDVGAAKAVAAIPVAERATRFIAAGGDIVLTAVPAQVPVMAAAVIDRAKAEPAFAAKVEAAATRVLTLKAAYGLLRCG